MPIPLNLPPPPQMDRSLLPYLSQLTKNIADAFRRASQGYSGTTTERLALTGANVGTAFYDQTLKREYIWSGTAWVCPHPFGQIGYGTRNTNSAAFIGIIYPLIVSGVPIEAGRKTRVSVHTNPASATAGASVSVSVCDGGGTIANQAYRICQTANAAEQISVEHTWENLAAGTYSFRIGAYANVSSYLAAGGTALTILRVDDLGPV